MQILESANLFSQDNPGVVNKGHREEGESSFSSILSRSKSEPSGTENGQSSHASGNKLPDQQARVDDQPHADDVSSTVTEQTDASAESNVNGEPSLTAGMDQPVQQRSLVPNELVTEEADLANAAGVTEQSLNDGDSAIASPEGQQLQGQVADIQLLAKMAPDSLSVQNNQVQKDVVDVVDDVADAGAVAGAGGVNASYLLTTGAGPVSSDAAPDAIVVREAVQSAIASQASSGGLKQFMQQNWNNQTASNLLPASNSVETSAVPFLQTLSDGILATPAARVQVPVGQPGWGEAVGQQVTWFVSQKISAASLRLNPQHLGPMEMAVSMDGDKASISFTSQHAIVRDALESSIPRLREMLSENGLDLVNVNVSQQGKSHGDGQHAPGSRQGDGVANADSGVNDGPDVRQITVHAQGLVDYYA
jgi:flagellar hook-length control protein FliK